MIYDIGSNWFVGGSFISERVLSVWFRKVQFSRDHIETIANGVAAISNQANREQDLMF